MQEIFVFSGHQPRAGAAQGLAVSTLHSLTCIALVSKWRRQMTHQQTRSYAGRHQVVMRAILNKGQRLQQRNRAGGATLDI